MYSTTQGKGECKGIEGEKGGYGVLAQVFCFDRDGTMRLARPTRRSCGGVQLLPRACKDCRYLSSVDTKPGCGLERRVTGWKIGNGIARGQRYRDGTPLQEGMSAISIAPGQSPEVLDNASGRLHLTVSDTAEREHGTAARHKRLNFYEQSRTSAIA